MKKRMILAAACAAAMGFVSTFAHADNLLKSGDFIIAVNPNLDTPNSEYPGGEAPNYVIDGDAGSKYLNFGRHGTGIIVTPGSSLIQSLVLTTGNDATERDPASFKLFGTNDPISSGNNGTGQSESWTPIASGLLSLPTDRSVTAAPVSFANAATYSSYKLIFPTLRNTAGTNSMQVGEIQFYSQPGGAGSAVLSAGNPILAIDTAVPSSLYPSGENPAKLLDGNPNSKYLNFSREGTGFIVTPSVGASVANGFVLATANDSAERDPASYEIYGTNAPITEADNGQGFADAWTLIASGSINLPDEREVFADPVLFENDQAYTSYKVIFTDNKGPDEYANSIQLGEFQLLGTVPEPATLGLLSLASLTLLRRRPR